MNAAFVALLALAFGLVGWMALLGDPASVQLLGAYVGASVLALVIALRRPNWASKIKWSWVALSLVVIFAIVSGPLQYLQPS